MLIIYFRISRLLVKWYQRLQQAKGILKVKKRPGLHPPYLKKQNKINNNFNFKIKIVRIKAFSNLSFSPKN